MEYTLDRTGDSPVTFRGELLATFKSRNADIPAPYNDHKQWITLDVYKTQSGKYVAAAHYRAGAKLGTETPVDMISIAASADTLFDKLAEINAADEFVSGWPGNQGRAEFHERLNSFACRSWDDVLNQAEKFCFKNIAPETIE